MKKWSLLTLFVGAGLSALFAYLFVVLGFFGLIGSAVIAIAGWHTAVSAGTLALISCAAIGTGLVIGITLIYKGAKAAAAGTRKLAEESRKQRTQETPSVNV